jgi:hypothetical protein
MSIGTLALGLYLLFVGAAQLGWFSVSNTLLGVLALVAGIIILLDAVHPVAWPGRRQV